MTYRVLVIEDDPDIQGYCNTVLESAGFAVDSTSTAEGARRLYGNRPDLIVLDIGLPDGNGIDLMREWQKFGATPPILFLTARGDMKTRLECFQQGAQDYLLKPFAAEELLARAKVHLQVKKSQDDLLRRNYELELVTRARQDMADMIVHDLKAPLTSIKGTLQLILAHGLISAEGYASLLQNAGSAADFMLLMLNDLLDVGQAEGLKAELATVEARPLFEKLQALFLGRAQLSGMEIAARVAPGAERLRADQNLLYRIGANLIANAMKASPQGSKIELDAERAGGKYRFIVSDRGRGVPDAEKTRIFEKYMTSHREGSPLETGTGLGLAFCRVATAALQGRIWVEDRPGGGSRFILELPDSAS
ncbi:MAG TPA: response regulator [Elusimicrobiota bacterium]|nr:response regulator [Elusimicrobiota bacterium]